VDETPDGMPAQESVSPFDVPTAPEKERIWDLCLAIAAGGALGGAARYGLNVLIIHDADEIPWSTLLENVLGSFVLGFVMVYLVDVWRPNRYLRPFLGVGVLGGFTTFSAFALETRDLLAEGEALLALLYWIGSPALGLTAAAAGTIAATALTRPRTRTS